MIPTVSKDLVQGSLYVGVGIPSYSSDSQMIRMN